MDEVQIVQECNRSEQLASKRLYMRARKWNEAAALEEVKDREAEQRRHDTDMSSPVEAVSQLDAAVPVVLVGSTEGLQDSQFDAACITVLTDDMLACVGVEFPGHLPLAQLE